MLWKKNLVNENVFNARGLLIRERTFFYFYILNKKRVEISKECVGTILALPKRHVRACSQHLGQNKKFQNLIELWLSLSISIILKYAFAVTNKLFFAWRKAQLFALLISLRGNWKRVPYDVIHCSSTFWTTRTIM